MSQGWDDGKQCWQKQVCMEAGLEAWTWRASCPSAPYMRDFPRLAGDPPPSPLCRPLADRHPISHGLGPAAAQTEEGSERGRMKTEALSNDSDQ